MLTLELINQCKANLQSSVADYNQEFLGRFINYTREESGIGGAYKAKMEECADAIETCRKRSNVGFDGIITSFNEIGKTVTGFVEAQLTANLANKIQDTTAAVGKMEVISERQTASAPGL